MNNMENAAADDMANALQLAQPLAVSTPKKPKQKPPLERMTDLFVANYAANQPTTLHHLHMEGFSEAEIEKYLLCASKAATRRINLAVHEH